MLLAQASFPALGQPLVTFLVSGLICLALFRPCVMALTSLAGSLLLACATLMLMNYAGLLDAPTWCEQSTVLLNWVVGAGALVGWLVQFLLHRYLFRDKPKGKGWLAGLWGTLASSVGRAGGKPAAARRT